jgi:hypothetical protein
MLRISTRVRFCKKITLGSLKRISRFLQYSTSNESWKMNISGGISWIRPLENQFAVFTAREEYDGSQNSRICNVFSIEVWKMERALETVLLKIQVIFWPSTTTELQQTMHMHPS